MHQRLAQGHDVLRAQGRRAPRARDLRTQLGARPLARPHHEGILLGWEAQILGPHRRIEPLQGPLHFDKEHLLRARGLVAQPVEVGLGTRGVVLAGHLLVARRHMLTALGLLAGNLHKVPVPHRHDHVAKAHSPHEVVDAQRLFLHLRLQGVEARAGVVCLQLLHDVLLQRRETLHALLGRGAGLQHGARHGVVLHLPRLPDRAIPGHGPQATEGAVRDAKGQDVERCFVCHRVHRDRQKQH
mmetsp:Transcript_89077/g.229854  ORF Transcript_89077/g.229854 Transcript_89077/m.229854 type:complete len:242 (-) Transcript_89077:3312-4037(-)